MNRVTLAAVLIAVLLGLGAGNLWWGRPAARMDTELREVRSSADQLGQQVETLRATNQRLQAELAAVQRDLASARDMNARLNQLISQGRK